MLRHQRSHLVRAPHVGLQALRRLDDRVEAHLDGLAVGGAAGLAAVRAQLAEAAIGMAAGEAFALGVLSLRSHDDARVDELLALTAERDDVQRGLASAFGWVSAADLRGVVARTLASPHPHAQAIALAACRMHRADPGAALGTALGHAAAKLRVAALRTAAHLGRHELLNPMLAALNDADPDVAFWAAWSACRLGERKATRVALWSASQLHNERGRLALQMLMSASTKDQASELARQISAATQAEPTGANTRRLIRAMGLLGDVRLVPWLIERMKSPADARLAGEAFSWITGADFAAHQLETLEAPESAAGPTEDPADDDVGMDEDEGLPWPDVAKVQAWWARSPLATAAPSARLVQGGPIDDRPHLQGVLREGTQRLRAHAALLLAVAEPTSIVFPVAAPAWRQQRWLAPAA